MSTTLTPIVTQLEIDRDRFKVLVNGDEFTTVQLENRVEGSIAKQVADRIASVSTELDRAETAANEAQDAALAASTSESEAQTYSQQASESAAEASDSSTKSESALQTILSLSEGKEASVFGVGDVLFPSEGGEVPSTGGFIVGRGFDASSERVRFSGRDFEIIQLASSFSLGSDSVESFISSGDYTPVTIINSNYDSADIPDGILSSGNVYAVQMTTNYTLPSETEDSEGDLADERKSDWVAFGVGSGDVLTSPSLSVSVSSQGYEVSITGMTGSITPIRVYRNRDKKIIFEDNNTTSTYIPFDLIESGESYTVQTQNIQLGETGNSYSPWVSEVLTNQRIIPSYTTKSIPTSGVIDVVESSVHRVDGTANTTLTLSGSPSSFEAQSIIVFVEDSGGTITWPTEVSWAGGNEPVLGTSWTNVVLFWTGSMWIGMESAKK